MVSTIFSWIYPASVQKNPEYTFSRSLCKSAAFSSITKIPTDFVRSTSLFLVLLLLSMLMSACVENAPDTVTPPSDTENITTKADTTPTPAAPDSAPTDTTYPGPAITENFAGKTIRILANEPLDTIPHSEIYYDGNSGDIINDAIFKRNARIIEKHGITIETTDVALGQELNTFTKAINAGNDDFHFASIRLSDLMATAQQGYLADVAELPYLDLDPPLVLSKYPWQPFDRR